MRSKYYSETYLLKMYFEEPNSVLQQINHYTVHINLVNLIIDTLASLALATEAPNSTLLDRLPYGRFDSIISIKMKKHILFQAIYQILILCILIFLGEYIIP